MLISAQETSTGDEVAAVNGVTQLLHHTKLQQGPMVVIGNDTTGFMRASIQGTSAELMETVLVAAFIVLLFLGRLNTAFSVILAIPIALAAEDCRG